MSHRQMHERERPSHRPENAEHRRPRPPSPTLRTPTTTATPKDHYDTLNPRRKARTERFQPRTGSSLHTGTARPTRSRSQSLFLPKGPPAHRTPPEPRRSTGIFFSVSPDEPIPRTRSFTKKRTLPGALGDVSGLACVTAVSPEKRRDATDIAASSAATPGHSPSPGSGILTDYFDGRPAVRHSRRFDRLTRARPPLDGTLLSFGLRRSRSNICYYHRDLHPRSAPPGSKASVLTAAPSYSSRHRSGARIVFVSASAPRKRSGIGPSLQRHPFSGPVDSAGELLWAKAKPGQQPNRVWATFGSTGLSPPAIAVSGPTPFTPGRFHVLLNSLSKVLFNFPSRYLSTIGLVPVFSLGDPIWAAFPKNFRIRRPTLAVNGPGTRRGRP
ncbi:unnamed protein product [Acanthosepion pharaonis]|uniref:Uncharacterized protein n=1 Tax=Acanthosepion pharaonis TaxID=158019 RepID=A0A812B8C5_ACAPH|nr:unnamed protein product [Sepia pharaonis]